MGMTPNFLARLINRPAMKALRLSLTRSEQEAVAYIAQLHQTGPGLYTAPRSETDRPSRSLRSFLPARWAGLSDGYGVHGGEHGATVSLSETTGRRAGQS